MCTPPHKGRLLKNQTSEKMYTSLKKEFRLTLRQAGVKTGLGYSGFRQFKGQNSNLSATCGIFPKKHVWECWPKFPCLLLVAEYMKYSALAGGFVLALILTKEFRDQVVTIEVFQSVIGIMSMPKIRNYLQSTQYFLPCQ